MNRPDVTITLRAEHLSWKAGFSDGDILDVFYETGDYHPEPESRHDVLVDVVRAYLIPDIEQALGRRLWPDYPIAGCHNPIRVSDDDRYQDWPESVKNLEVVVDRDMFEQCRQGVLNRPEYLKADTAWTDDSPKKAKSSHRHHLSHVAALVAVGLIVDLFAGGGGASTGIEAGMGRQVDEAANHDPSAIAMHEINHPLTSHHQADIRELDPIKVCNGRPVDVLWASPDCFIAGTMILTDTGYRPIETIQEGDMVLTHTGRFCRVYATNVTQKPIVEVEIQGVPTIRTTAEHPFYVRSATNVWDNHNRRYQRNLGDPRWSPALSLRTVGAPLNAAAGDLDFCATPCAFPELPIPSVPGRGMTVDERLLWLAGLYVGDGWTRLTDDKAELVITYGKDAADELWGQLDKWPRHGDRSQGDELAWYRRDTNAAHQFTTSHRGLVEWLRQEFGHLAGAKRIPAWLLGASSSLRQAFLDGYCMADSSTFNARGVTGTETVTISPALAYSTKALVESLGNTAQVYGPRENSAFIQGRVVNAQPTYMVRWRHESLRAQTMRDDLHNWSRVQAVIPTGKVETVYNFSVEQDETYIADGIVVHNCKHFSKAKGGKPVDKNIRSLADVVIDWAEAVEIQQGIVLENVEEFEDWGPLIETHKGLMPCPDRKGEDFRRWVRQIRNAGATSVEWRTLRACDYGAPTIRKRLFLIARFDGQPIVWPAPTHGHRDSWEVKAGILLPFKTAADCIDWSIPCQSVINRAVPLKDATNRRIAAGLVKFVLTAAKSFIVPITHTTNGNQAHSIDDPLRTITTAKGGEFALVEPTLEKTADIAAFIDSQYGQSRGVAADEPVPTVMANGGGKQAVVTADLEPVDRIASYLMPLTHQGSHRGVDMNDPAPTITGANRGELALIEAKLESATKVAAFMAQHNSGFYEGAGRSVAEPLSAITMRATQQQLVTANLVKLRGTGNRHGQPVTEPMHTLTAGGQHMGLVYAFLVKYYGAASDGQKLDDPMHTVTGLARFGLVTVTVDGEEYVVTDIAMRMLTPRELARAQGFPDSYVLDPVCWYRTDSGKMKHGRLPKTHQIARIGNSVCPIMAEVLTRANFARPKPQPLELERMAA